MILRGLARMLVPLMLPIGCKWMQRQERRILSEGVPLNAAQTADARALGIREPERVRVLVVDRVPLPGGSGLARTVGRLTGMLSHETAGMAIGHGVFLRQSLQHDRRLLAHELVHVRQYERQGGPRPFLRQYLRECLAVGYFSAPMEEEARADANTLCG